MTTPPQSESPPEPEARERPPGPIVVGIGASAGGLEALEAFFATVPADAGIAYVVVQHLAPEHISMLTELLGRRSPMPVAELRDGLRPEPDQIYVIAPGTQIDLINGAFRVRGLGGERHHQIDGFLRSLAEDRRMLAIGVLLSGTGDDGTAGLRAIRERGGLTLAQAPETARYGTMPRSAIDAGVVDHVLPPAAMPAMILERVRALARGEPFRRPAGPPIARSPAALPPAAAPPDEALQAALPQILERLRRSTGHDFSQYKLGTVRRRLLRRLHLRSASLPAYLEILANDAQEPALLARDLLIGVTHFFRDPEAFDLLATRVFPAIFTTERDHEAVRIWVPGCASGEEVYSLGILVHELIAGLEHEPAVQIFATDIDAEAVAEARRARYPADIAQHVAPGRLARFFTEDEGAYRVDKAVRDLCVFSEHSLIRDPPFLGLDLISCRNVLIYLDAELQKKLIPLFHYALRPGGYLFLGPSEGLAGHAELFEAVDKRLRVFRRAEVLNRPPVEFLFSRRMGPRTGTTPPHAPTPPPPPKQAIHAAFERLMLQEYMPPAAVVTASGDILSVVGFTGRYLQPAAGILTGNIHDIAHTGLRVELRTALRAAARRGKAVIRDDVPVEVEGAPRRLRLTVRPIPGIKEDDLFAVILEERGRGDEADEGAAEPAASGDDDESLVAQLEGELRTTRQSLRATIEELEVANEELKSSNEELVATNEEMQSASEELQSSQEELKSVNEELTTVNSELRSKLDELAQANSDLQNLLSSTDVATLFLDQELRVARFTPAAKALLRLIEADIGRPIADLASRFVDVDLAADVQEVLRTLHSIERQVETVDRRAWYLLRVLPYRTVADVIAGAVVTLADITRVKRAEADLRASEEKYRTLFESIDEGFCIVEVLYDDADRALDYRFLEVNPAFKKQTGIAEAVGRSMREIAPDYEEQWFRSFGEVARTGVAVRFEGPAAALGRIFDVYAFRVGEPEARQVAILVGDITARKEVEAQRARFTAELEAAQERLRRLLRVRSFFVSEGGVHEVFGGIVDAAIAITDADCGSLQILDRTSGDLKIAATRGLPAWWVEFWDTVHEGQGSCGTALARGEPVVVEDVEASPIFAGAPALEIQRRADVRAVQSMPLIGRDGEPIGMLSTHYKAPGRPSEQVLQLLDLFGRQAAAIVERVQTEMDLEDANRRLVEADCRKDEFLAMLSHELRSPLTPLRSGVDVLMEHGVDGPQAARVLAVLDRQLGHLTRLIEDLVDVTRISRGKVQLRRERVELVALVKRAAADHHQSFVDAGVALEPRPAAGEVWVDGDPMRLSQAIGNLLQNAVKFTPHGGAVTVSVTEEPIGELARVCVEDSGRGIAPELLPQVFEPFVQADTTLDRTKGGLGLGLAVVKGLVEMHQGSVRAESDGPGAGAVFTITLPIAAPVERALESPTPPRGPTTARRVLIIEDHVDTAHVLRAMLERSGHAVAVAFSGPEGLEMARAFDPELVLCDIGLPGMNGYEVARALRADPELGRVYLVALTGYARPEDIESARLAGFDRHLAKPVGLDEMEQLLAEFDAGGARPQGAALRRDDRE